MMSESTKMVPRSMTLGLGFSSPEDPDEFGKDMWAVRQMLHSSGHLLGLYIHVIYVSPRGCLFRTSSGSRRALARVRKTASQVSSGPRRLSGDHIHPCALTLFRSTWTLRTTPEEGGGCAAAADAAAEEHLVRPPDALLSAASNSLPRSPPHSLPLPPPPSTLSLFLSGCQLTCSPSDSMRHPCQDRADPGP